MRDAMQEYFDPKPESVSSARQFAIAALDSWGLEELVEDIRLCVSELASNALVHGTDDGQGFLVKLAIEDDFVRLEVHDSRPRDDHGPQVRHPVPSVASGRGLLIVQILADGWGVEDRQPFGKIVWSCFKAATAVREAGC